MRHIFTPDDETIKKICSHNNLLDATFQPHPIKMGFCSTNKKSLIVTTINPICHSCPVYPGTKKSQFVALKARKTSSLHTIILKEQTQRKHIVVFNFI